MLCLINRLDWTGVLDTRERYGRGVENHRYAEETKQRNNRNYLDELKQVLKQNI